MDAVHTKTGYGTVSTLPLTTLEAFDAVYVCGADTDACVLAVALGLFDAGVPVVVRADLCLSAGGTEAHLAGMAVLTRQLGRNRVLDGTG